MTAPNGSICSFPPYGLDLQTPAYRMSLAFTIIFPIFIVTCFLTFAGFKKSSIYLRKRRLDLVLLSCFAAMLTWASTVLYDYLGSEAFPCALLLALVYFSLAISSIATFLKLTTYVNEVQYLRLIEMKITQRSHNQNEEEETEEDDRISIKNEDLLSPIVSLRAIFIHLRFAFLGSTRIQEDRILNSRFTRSKFFVVLWVLMVGIPFILAFFVRLGTDAVLYKGCHGCELTPFDCYYSTAWLLVMLIIAFKSQNKLNSL